MNVDPTNARALAALGKLREESGESQQALANYQRSLQLDPYQPQLASRIAAMNISTTAPVVTPPDGTRIVTTPQTDAGAVAALRPAPSPNGPAGPTMGRFPACVHFQAVLPALRWPNTD